MKSLFLPSASTPPNLTNLSFPIEHKVELIV